MIDLLDIELWVERAGGLLLALSGLVVLGWTIYRGFHPPPRFGWLLATGRFVSWVSGGFLYTLAAFVFGSCHGVYVGEAPRATVGIRAATPVVAALDRFRADSGYYPARLTLLAQAYLPDTALLLPARGRFTGGWRYLPSDSTYQLSFEYHGPGVNECLYQPAQRRWSCGGHF